MFTVDFVDSYDFPSQSFEVENSGDVVQTKFLTQDHVIQKHRLDFFRMGEEEFGGDVGSVFRRQNGERFICENPNN